MANVQSSTTVTFPKAKKRGAKVRTGPCARVIPLPGIYVGDQLEERFEFIRNKAGEWSTLDTEGTQAVDWKRRGLLEAIGEVIRDTPWTEHYKRRQIAEGRARIDTRNRIKIYLERRGVDLDKIRNAEEALFALFGFVETTP